MQLKELNARIQTKRDTSANWTNANPVLLYGEMIIVDTANGEIRYKVGDGVKHYSELPFTDEIIRGSISTAQTTANTAISKIDTVQAEVESVRRSTLNNIIHKKERKVYIHPAEGSELHVVSHIGTVYSEATKNILPVHKWGSEWNGVSYTWNEDAGLHIVGTTGESESGYSLIEQSSNLVLKQGMYTFSTGVVLPAGVEIYVEAYENAEDYTGYSSENSYVMSNEDSATFMATGMHEYVFTVKVLPYTDVNVTIYPQLEVGEYSTGYVPYCDIPGPIMQGITLQITNGEETKQYKATFDRYIENAEYDWNSGKLIDLDVGSEYNYEPCEIKALNGLNVIEASAGIVEVTGFTADAHSQKMGRYNHIPRLYLYGDTSEMTKDNAVMLKFKYAGADNYINDSFDAGLRENGRSRGGWVKAKWQGSSSTAFPKKNYTFTFYWDANGDNKRSIQLRSDWGAQSKYCAKANFIDPTHCRNVVAAKLWGECVRSRNAESESYIRMNALPNAGAVDGYPMLVFVNDEYQGIYTMNIPKADWMFGMKDGEGVNAVLCAEDYSSSATFYAQPTIDGTDWSYEVEPADKSWVQASFAAIRNAIEMPMTNENEIAAKKAALEACVDIYSVIDYDVFLNALGLSDNSGKNQLMITYDGTKWIMGAYDLDTAFGNHWSGAKYQPLSVKTDYYNGLTWDVRTLYADEHAARKAELKNGCLSKANIFDKLMNFVVDIPQEAFRAEAELWPDMCGANSNSMQQIVAFIESNDNISIDYDRFLAFDTSDIVVKEANTTSELGRAILGLMVLA